MPLKMLNQPPENLLFNTVDEIFVEHVLFQLIRVGSKLNFSTFYQERPF